MAGLVRHRQTKGSATDRLHLNHRATPRRHTSGFTDIGVQNRNLGGSVIAAGDCFVLVCFFCSSISSSTPLWASRPSAQSGGLCPVTALDLPDFYRVCTPLLACASFTPLATRC